MTIRTSLLALFDNDEALYPHFLEERFPHVLNRLVSMFGKPQLSGFIEGLLAPPGEGVSGFPVQALVEIQRIQDYCFPESTPVEAKHKTAMLDFLDSEGYAYPHELETEFPELFKKILGLLERDDSSLEPYLDHLLSTDKQFEHRFSEQVLMELMTLKSIRRAQQKQMVSQHIDAENQEDHTASMIFDKVQRW